MRNAIIIPSLEPDFELVNYIEELTASGFDFILVVNDGSSEKSEAVFREISAKKNCTLLTHTLNMGKGAALKTAIRYISENIPHIDGIITVDADGQHSVKDVIRMNQALIDNPEHLILGVRDFGEGTPTKSLIGNTVSSKTLKFLYGIDLKDTQTGLRAVARKHFTQLLRLPGERYEYELNMIIYSKKLSIKIHTITIDTLYFNGNSGSHFRPIRDGGKVYFQMLKGLFQYMGNSVIAATVDITLFTVIFYLTQSALTATVATAFASSISRIASSLVDFRLNRSTFASKESTSYRAYYKYYTLWVVQLLSSIALISLASTMFGVVQTVVKPFVDLALAVLSYQIQLHWVFKPEEHRKSAISNAYLMKTKGNLI